METSVTQFVNKVDEKMENTLFGKEVKGLLDNYILDLPGQLLKVPKDPFSKEYYDHQMKLHSIISQKKTYSPVENEASEFTINYNRPFPYNASGDDTIGDQLIAIGYIFKVAALNKNSRILEFGPGWGNTTVQLALAGHEVTAVEIDANFCDLLEYRKKQHKLDNNLIIVNQDMVQFTKECDSHDYDAVLFYESFHHCWNHHELCSNLNKLLKEDGVIIFAAEPILEKCSHFPYPWGVRIDGMSVYSTRKFGWLELGFEMNYFTEMMRSNGFEIKEYKSDMSPLSRILLGRKIESNVGKADE